MALEAGDRLLGGLPSVGLEKADGGNLAQLLAQAARLVGDFGNSPSAFAPSRRAASAVPPIPDRRRFI
jgi:hypothetical protein